MWMAAGRMPSARTTRRLVMTRSTAMEKLAKKILRHAPAVRCNGADIVDRTDFGGKRRNGITAADDGRFGFHAAQGNGRDTGQRDARLARAAVLQAGETHLRDGLGF